MAFFLRDNDDEVLEGNRYYWKITKLLQDMSSRTKYRNEVDMTFKLHSKTWQNQFCFQDDGFVYAFTDRFHRRSVHYDHLLFDLRTGIVGDDKKEIIAESVWYTPFEKLISRSEFDSILLSNKVLYLFSEIRRKDENVQKKISRKQQIETEYRDLLLSGRNSDVILTVKHKKFYCHRCILAVRSPVFAAMMKNDIEDTAIREVIIEDADPNVFQKFLLFLYTGNEDYLSWQNITDLFNLADKYGLEDIKNICRKDIKENIRSSNFCDLFKFSLLHNDSELKNICRDALQENILPSHFCKLFELVLQHNDSELTKMFVQFFLRHSKDIVRHENWATFLSEDSKKWLSVDQIKKNITTENFFFFFMLSQIQKDSELTETTVKFFLKKSVDIVQSENWMAFQVENPFECHVLIRALAKK